MINILKTYLNKLGVKDYSSLMAEERTTYKAWEEALKVRKLTDEDVETFLASELEDTENKLIVAENGSRTDTFLKVKLEFIRKIRKFRNSPVVEQQMVSRNIEGLINKI